MKAVLVGTDQERNPCRPLERPMVACADQRAAAENELAPRWFVTAHASIAWSVSITASGRQRAPESLPSVATGSAVLSESDHIDSWFD